MWPGAELMQSTQNYSGKYIGLDELYYNHYQVWRRFAKAFNQQSVVESIRMQLYYE